MTASGCESGRTVSDSQSERAADNRVERPARARWRPGAADCLDVPEPPDPGRRLHPLPPDPRLRPLPGRRPAGKLLWPDIRPGWLPEEELVRAEPELVDPLRRQAPPTPEHVREALQRLIDDRGPADCAMARLEKELAPIGQDRTELPKDRPGHEPKGEVR